MCKNCFLKEDKVTASSDFELKIENIHIENNNVDIEPVVVDIELTEIEVSDFDLESVASK
jgi:hypothetical protein